MTFLQAFIDAVDDIPGLPDPWFDQLPEGSAEAFPNIGVEHLGEVPTYHKRAGQLSVAYTMARARVVLFHDSAFALDALATTVINALTPTVLQFALGGNVSMMRGEYRANYAGYVSKNGKKVYRGQIEYEARIDEV